MRANEIVLNKGPIQLAQTRRERVEIGLIDGRKKLVWWCLLPLSLPPSYVLRGNPMKIPLKFLAKPGINLKFCRRLSRQRIWDSRRRHGRRLPNELGAARVSVMTVWYDMVNSFKDSWLVSSPIPTCTVFLGPGILSYLKTNLKWNFKLFISHKK